MKILFFIIALSIGTKIIGQTPDLKVIEHLGNEKADQLLASSPDKYEHLLNYINSSWYVQDVSFKDLANVTDFRTVEFIGNGVNRFDDGKSFYIENFNPLLYNIPIQNKYPTTYKLGDTGKIITFYSREYFIKKLNDEE